MVWFLWLENLRSIRGGLSLEMVRVFCGGPWAIDRRFCEAVKNTEEVLVLEKEAEAAAFKKQRPREFLRIPFQARDQERPFHRQSLPQFRQPRRLARAP